MADSHSCSNDTFSRELYKAFRNSLRKAETVEDVGKVLETIANRIKLGEMELADARRLLHRVGRKLTEITVEV